MIEIISRETEMPPLMERRYRKKCEKNKWFVLDTHSDEVRYKGKYEDVAIACHNLNKKFYSAPNDERQDVPSTDWLAFIKALPGSENYVYQDKDGCWVTQEWLCGASAGRGFVGETFEAACAEMVEYLNSHIGHDSAIGNMVKASGWPNQKMVKEYLNWA